MDTFEKLMVERHLEKGLPSILVDEVKLIPVLGKTKFVSKNLNRDREFSGKLRVRLDSRIHILDVGLPAGLLQDLQRALVWPNPTYAKAKYYGKATDGIQPEIRCLWPDPDGGGLSMGRGFLPGLIELLHKYRIRFQIENRAVPPAKTDWDFSGYSLMSDHEKAAFITCLNQTVCLLVGPLGSGRKLVVMKMAAWLRLPVLIVVKTKRQMYVWREAAQRYLNISDPKEIGLIGDRKKQIGRPVTVGIFRSVYLNIAEVKGQGGILIVDDANLSPLTTYFKIVGQLDWPYLLGIATGIRRPDGLANLMQAYLGPAVVIRPPQRFVLSSERPRLKVQKTGFEFNYNRNYAEMLAALIDDSSRNRLIVADLLQQAATRGRVLAVSQRVEHLKTLQGLIHEARGQSEIISGVTSEKKREEICRAFNGKKLSILLVTLKSFPDLDEIEKINCLVIACPFKAISHLADLLGKLLAPRKGDPPVIIDYLDPPGPLRNSLHQRFKIYRQMGVIQDAAG